MSTRHRLAGQYELPLPDSPALICSGPNGSHRRATRKDAPGRLFCERCGVELDPSTDNEPLR